MKSKYLLFFSHLASFIRGSTFGWLKRILTILVLVISAFVAYEYSIIRVNGYPREMHLMDKQYRIIPVHLEGRTATHLHITRRDTARFFTYEINDLHLLSQWQMRLYPVMFKIGKTNEPNLSKIHAEQTLAARDRLIEENEDLLSKTGDTESVILIRSLEKKITKNLKKIRDLESRIKDYDIEYQAYENTEKTSGLLESLTDVLDRIAIRDALTAARGFVST